MLSLKNIYKWHNNAANRVFLLKDVSLEVKESEFIKCHWDVGRGQ
jgi:ABC-type lipoprotein export system ATPase subunit